MTAKERIIPLGVRIPAVSPNNSAEVFDKTSAHFLSATRRAKQLFLIGWRMYLQQVAFVAALVQADTALRELDEIVFRLIQLEHFHVAALVDGARVEQELVGRDTEQRLGHFAHLFLIKVLQILRCQQHGGFLFTHTLEAVADVLNGRGIGQPDIQLVQRRHGIAHRQKLIRHERQYIEQHGVADIFSGTQHSLDTEDKEAAGGEVGVPIEELCVRTLAHGVQSQQNFLQELLRIEQMGVGIVAFEFFFDQVIEIRENRIVLRAHTAEIGPLCDAPFRVELGYHDLNGVDMGIREILVGAKEVLEEGNVLCQQGAFSEGFRGGCIVRVAAVIPAFRLQHIDDVLTRHKVGKAAADSFAHFLLLMLGIQV